MSKEVIAFHVNHFSLRGSEVAIYDYARYNEEILHNKSIIAVHIGFRDKKDYRGVGVHNDGIYKKFSSRFAIIEYSNTVELHQLLVTNGVTIFYNLKSGENDNFILPGIKNVNHCVFTYDKKHAHGDIYIPISPAIVDPSVRTLTPHVPHIVSVSKVDGDLREFLGIPKDAIVFGRHGGEESFNIPFVHEVVQQVADENENIYFLFLNTHLFCAPKKNIIFLRGLSEVEDKTRFINTCDAMLHARKEGESFGIAIAEFSVLKKPIITWKHTPGNTCGMKIDTEHTHHIDTLGESGLYYSDRKELDEILTTFVPNTSESLDCYSRIYSPQVVMGMFNRYIINQTNSVYNFIDTREFDGMKYTHFERDDVAKSLYKNGWEPHVYTTIKHLLKSGDTFIDIGSNIGYHTVRTATIPNIKVVSVEPQKDVFALLKHNVESNNLKNVICLNVGLSIVECTKYIPRLLFSSSNMGDIPTRNKYKPDTDPSLYVDMDYLFQSYSNIKVIKIDVSGSELDVLKGGVRLLVEQRPYIIIPLETHTCKRNGYSCRSVKNLLNSLKYSMIEIGSDYPCDHLCYPNEKQSEVESIFGKYIQDNKIVNQVNGNLSIGINKTIRYKTEPVFVDKCTRVKLMCNWTSSEDLCNCWSKMSKGDCRWNDIKVTHEDDVDYYVIINKPLPNEKYDPKKTIVFRMEPDTETSERWNDWYKSKDDFMYFLDLSKFRNNSEWHLGLSYNDMNKPIEKTKVMSTVVSSLYNMEGHRKRIDFVKHLQSNDIDVDVYGRDNLFGLSNHKGELPYHNKNDGILPYKYTFIAENCSMDNYFTEKLLDSILGETVCFYWGCPNVDKFIDSKAFIRLDLDDFSGSMNTVKEAIQNDEWSKRIHTIREEKKKIINHYSFFPRIEGLIRLATLPCSVVNLDRRPDRWSGFQEEASRVGFKSYSRFSAIDGNEIAIDKSIVEMFRNFPRKPKRGEVGCAMSHHNIWKNVKQDTLILEDDIKFTDNFIDQLAMVYNHIKNTNLDFDVVFIGYHLNKDVMDEKNITENDLLRNKNNILVSMEEVSKQRTSNHMFGYHGGGTFGYIISPRGAKKLLNTVSENGFVWPVDYHMLLSTAKGIKTYCTVDRLVLSDMYTKEASIDTDIQNTPDLF